jgi:hypothetical protein
VLVSRISSLADEPITSYEGHGRLHCRRSGGSFTPASSVGCKA